MASPRLRSTAVSIALLVSGAACGLLDRDPPPTRTASQLVKSPDGAIEASGVVKYIKGHDNFHSGVPSEVVYVVALDRRGERREVEFERFSDGYLGTPKEELARAAKASMAIAFAPDGHALSVSTDGGKSFAYVVLDEGDAPFVCLTHAPSSTIAPTRDLVVSTLRESALGEKKPLCDLKATVRYTCAHKADAELTRAFAEAYTRAPELVGETLDEILGCLRDIARDDAGVRTVLLAGLTGRASTASQIAVALDRSSDPEVQAALAAALTANLTLPAPDHEASLLREHLAWSLASITARRRDATAPARAALIALARSGEGDEGSAKHARVYAVGALAALGPEEHAVLEELAKPCAEAAIPWALPAEPMAYGRIEARSVACFAKDARAGARP